MAATTGMNRAEFSVRCSELIPKGGHLPLESSIHSVRGPKPPDQTVRGRPLGALSCPQWAGLVAIADQINGGGLGLINPAL